MSDQSSQAGSGRADGEALTSLELVHALVDWLEEKQVADIVVLDIGADSSIADYFLIGTVVNDRHARAIEEDILTDFQKADPCSAPGHRRPAGGRQRLAPDGLRGRGPAHVHPGLQGTLRLGGTLEGLPGGPEAVVAVRACQAGSRARVRWSMVRPGDATSRSVARFRKRPCSTTPARADKRSARRNGSSMGPKSASRM